MGKEIKPYVRLHATTLYLAPECYENPKAFSGKTCSLCPVHPQCLAGQPIEMKEVEVWDASESGVPRETDKVT
jgi:hypothetical protein